MPSFLLIAIFLIGVFFAGLFAGAETGIYQVSRLRLRLGIEKKRFTSVVLGKALHDTSGLLTSTLVGTNLSIYIVTSCATYIVLKRIPSGHSAELYATLITAPPLFIFSELIPKTVFFYYADSLMLRISPLLFGFYRLLSYCGVIAVFRYISLALAKLTHTPIPAKRTMNTVRRHETAAFFKDIHEESFLSAVQTDIVNRLLIVSNTTANQVMISAKNTQFIAVNSNRRAVLDKLKQYDYSRLSVYEGKHDNILGFVNVYEVLCSKKQFVDLYSFIKPIKEIPHNTLVTDAMEIMQQENHKIALVVRVDHKDHRTPVGIITTKDLIEELFGELDS